MDVRQRNVLKLRKSVERRYSISARPSADSRKAMNAAKAPGFICFECVKSSGNYPVGVGIINLPIRSSSVIMGRKLTTEIEKVKANLPFGYK